MANRTKGEAHYRAKRHTGNLHEGVSHKPVDRETHRLIHRDTGDHTSGQSLPRDEQEATEARSQPKRYPKNAGFHRSTRGYEHDGYEHTSKDR